MKGDLQCLDETGELWLVRAGDPGHALVTVLPKNQKKAGWVLYGDMLRTGKGWTQLQMMALDQKIEGLSRWAGDPDVEPVLIRMIQLRACLRALAEQVQ